MSATPTRWQLPEASQDSLAPTTTVPPSPSLSLLKPVEDCSWRAGPSLQPFTLQFPISLKLHWLGFTSLFLP
ncbi:hypothetical protein NUW54_g4656 [Trametes sanguinea]|uniref:Uncharacterized protein n=1 Tax=Trametes sanguinea TaxID=158606 RepID=A0ACC1PXV5_9APHY|nr:hypothetical protein NUW54_g4656 [Trametes sanguinea]